MANHTGEDKESTKAGLRAWWSSFARSSKLSSSPSAKDRKTNEKSVFGEPLRKSLKYASVAISMAGEDGQQYVWGYVPVIVAKVGLYLKERATEVEGVFRIAGSQKRMRELQETFDTGPRYGKNVNWEKYSVHDAASVLRRYLNQMPEPIVPLDLYSEFRNVMHKQPLDVEAATKTYRLLIASMPPANQYLLLYILDLLAVFARKSETNRMPASNLAVIFQPGIFSHPSHLQDANEHKTATEVLEFLIEHQDHFVIGLNPPLTSNVDSAELTSVSIVNQTQGDPDVAELSESDEELGVLTMHEGGGAKLTRRSTTTGGGGGRKGLFKLRKSGGSTPAGGGRKEGDSGSLHKEEEVEPSTPKGEIREMGLTSSPAMVKVGGGLRRSRTVPSRRAAARDAEEKRSVSSGKARAKQAEAPTKTREEQDETTQKVEAKTASDPTTLHHPDPGLPTPPPSKLLTEEQKS